MEKEKISFVIPCYRSEKTITFVVDDIVKLMSEIKNNYDYEIILVNDSSPDNVWQVIKDLVNQNDKIKAISFAKNFGQHSALMAGYGVATGDIIVTADDDGQTPIDTTMRLIEKINEGFDVVYASYEEKKESAWRVLGSKINNKMSEVLIGKPKDVYGNSFYAMKKYICKEIVKYKNAYPYIGGLVYRVTKNITNVSVEHRERLSGTSGYSFFKLIKLFMNGFTAFSVVPLRFSSLVGCICAVIGFIYGIITIIRKLVIPSISVGWSSTVAIILFVGGLIMLMLGMIGEYIGRIYISLNNSPQYVVKETINLKNDEKKD